jgi:UDP-glucose 4-epimerase
MGKILITGSNSFVGKNFIKHSKNRNVEEISLFENKPADIDFSRFDVVIHLAAYVHQSGSVNEDEYFRINRDLCLEVAKYAKEMGIKQFLFLSTVKVYGDIERGNITLNEDSPCSPQDAYGKSKLAAEMALKELEDEHFRVSIIRTPIVYGAGVKANMLSMIKLVDHSFILPFRDVKNKRSFTYVENLVGFIDRIIEKRASGIFIVMDKYPLSTTELVILISKSLHKKLILIKLSGFVLSLIKYILPNLYIRLFTSFAMDNQKTLKILEYSPPFASEEGIKRTVEWYKLSKK